MNPIQKLFYPLYKKQVKRMVGRAYRHYRGNLERVALRSYLRGMMDLAKEHGDSGVLVHGPNIHDQINEILRREI